MRDQTYPTAAMYRVHNFRNRGGRKTHPACLDSLPRRSPIHRCMSGKQIGECERLSRRRPIQHHFQRIRLTVKLVTLLEQIIINLSAIGLLLRQYIGESEGREAATHWRGGVYRLYEHKQAKYPVLAHSSEWDSPEAARAFFDLYQRVLRAKWKRLASTYSAMARVFP